MMQPDTAMAQAMAKALRAKSASVPNAAPVRVSKNAPKQVKPMVKGAKPKEPDADEHGGPSDHDADDIRAHLKKAMK